MLTELGALVLPAVPLLALLACLLLGRFPGENAIERLSRRFAGTTRRRTPRNANRRRNSHPVAAIPRGGLLIASGMARRPPPALA